MQDSDASVKLRPTISSISSQEQECSPVSSLTFSRRRSYADKSLQTEMPTPGSGWSSREFPTLGGEIHLRLQRPGALLSPNEDSQYVEMVRPLFQLGDLDSLRGTFDDSQIPALLDLAESHILGETPLKLAQPFILNNKLFGGKLLNRLAVSDIQITSRSTLVRDLGATHSPRSSAKSTKAASLSRRSTSPSGPKQVTVRLQTVSETPSFWQCEPEVPITAPSPYPHTHLCPQPIKGPINLVARYRRTASELPLPEDSREESPKRVLGFDLVQVAKTTRIRTASM